MADERHTSFMDALAALNRHYLVGVPEAREVWLVRHADAYAGLERLADGRIDPPLSPVGQAQAARLAVRLAPVPIDAVWSSDLLRARQTAEPVAAGQGLELGCDERLREVRTHWDEGTAQPELSRGEYPFPEPAEETIARMEAAVADIVAALPQRAEGRARAVVVTHSAAILVYLTHLLHLSWRQLPMLPQFTSVSVLAVGDGRTVVHSIGDVTHLALPVGD
ncbi:MAG TPA: histidine phosphatase family protein [Candidatus Dormibacteraeota bacterium]|jgi:probable phosphoglycerate mutase|nr:histidine phosphatase family protein [Candidatus Dormibacteraeota bacterium]